MTDKPLFKKILQVGLVVRDLDDSMKKYLEISGIGPWDVYTFDGTNIENITVRGERKDFAIRVGLANIGGVQWELIEPLDDDSIYAEFLKEHGEGLHHLALEVDNYKKTISHLSNHGVEVLQEGRAKGGFGFAYLDTTETLSCITEIYDIKLKRTRVVPEAVYPEKVE